MFVPFTAAVLGGELRLGYQINPSWNAFVVAGGSVPLGTTVYFPEFFFGAIAEYLPNDLFYVGGGAILAYGFLGAEPYSPGGVRPSTFGASFKPGLDLRLGLSAAGEGLPPSFRRGGFNIGLDAVLLFHPDMDLWTESSSTMALTVRTTTIVTFTPMLTIGYDAR